MQWPPQLTAHSTRMSLRRALTLRTLDAMLVPQKNTYSDEIETYKAAVDEEEEQVALV